jgi:hypothetical protein
VEDHLVIRDLGSTNGIRINGVKVAEGSLRAEDEVTIGNVRYQVKYITEGDRTQNTPQNGVKAGMPPMRPAKKQLANDLSRDEPMPLPDLAQAHPILPAPASPKPLEFPDSGDVNLAPLDPPSKH